MALCGERSLCKNMSSGFVCVVRSREQFFKTCEEGLCAHEWVFSSFDFFSRRGGTYQRQSDITSRQLIYGNTVRTTVFIRLAYDGESKGDGLARISSHARAAASDGAAGASYRNRTQKIVCIAAFVPKYKIFLAYHYHACI
jgi:hypothetical protein